MLAIFVSSRMPSLINWKPPNVAEIKLSASACTSFFAKVNWLIVNFYEISTGKDLRLFFMAIFCLWILSVIGTYVSALNLFYIVVLCLESLPALYERHQMEVDNVAVKVNREMRKLYMKFEHKVLEKIPRGPVKGRKLY